MEIHMEAESGDLWPLILQTMTVKMLNKSHKRSEFDRKMDKDR